MIGMDSRYKYVSPSYDSNFSLGMGTLTGKLFSVTLHPDDIALCSEVGTKCIETPGTLFPVTLRKHDGLGGFVTTQWEMQCITDSNGVPDCVYCIGYNISDFVNTQNKLDHAENQLDEIGFLQSHAVRKPLANIIGISKLFELVDNPDEYPALIKMLHQSTTELDQIIQEISRRSS
ncbi:hypothetical protein MUY27_15925 [Mucilaginibacter sp. RS28]|uniref:histidine kinase n=1 Tax=Mucilaginibacter straminoryzae TaxID=2932774 RepID=A0A9X1X4U0_9SPHI|nr:hypothetical protein [Mucilaginibacter straminoryzae]MCJ8211207.1 hypothetical protein [Mucilaginibacter straminoryzae]